MELFNVTDFVDRENLAGAVNVFHSAFFHGYITNLAHFTLDQRAPEIRYIIKNGYSTGPILMPGISLIFREDIARRAFQLLPDSMKLSPVQFKKVFSFPFSPGDRSYERIAGYPDIDSILDTFRADRVLESLIPRYYLCSVPRLHDINIETSRSSKYLVDSPSSVYSAAELFIDEDVFDRFDVLWHRHGMLTSERFLESFCDAFDPRYFEITKIEKMD